MFDEKNEQSINCNSSFNFDPNTGEQFELLFPEQLDVTDNAFEAPDFELDNYFMELELEFDE